MINKEIKTIGRIFQVLIFGGLGLWLAFGILVRQAQAGSPAFYIDAITGNDLTGSGSSANPYRTIQKAHDVSVDGMTEIFYIKAGAVYSSFNVTKGGASPDKPDIYTVWPGSGTYPKIFENKLNLIKINANYVTLDGLEVDGSAGAGTGDLIYSDESITASYITIRNSKVHHSAGDEGIQLKNAPHAWIENVESYNNAGDGINLCCGSYSSTVRFNYAHDNIGALAHGGFYFYESGKSMDGLLVEHNVSVNNREAGINLEDVDGAIIRNNLISHTLTNGSRGVGIFFNNATLSNTVSNNTISNSASDGLRVDDPAGLNNTIRDNIIFSSTNYAIYAAVPTQTVDYNLYGLSGLSETYNVITGAHSIITNPLFVTGLSGPAPDFYLDPASPAVNVGSQTAAAAGLSLYTTRADQQVDQGLVDVGYHYAAWPYTLTLTPAPTAIVANGLSTTTLTALLQTSLGQPVPDGTTVVFNSSLGYFSNQMSIYAAQTTGGQAQAVLNSAPASSTVIAVVKADVYGTATQTPVSFTAPACGADLTQWTEYTAHPIFGQGAGGPKAYYPSVLYSSTQFDGHGDAAYYKMWFGTESSKTGYATSNDGLTWITQTLPLTDINGYHAFVLYDAAQFGGHGDAAYYKMWYWDASNSVNYATSSDGVNWANYPGNPVITNALGWKSAPVYDANVIYNSDGNPAYYEAWIDNNGKFYYITSTDGITWTGDNQEFLTDRQSWESVTYSRLSVLKQDGVYHMWYGGASGGGGNQGIGYAVSIDGKNWAKSVDNPIFYKDDGPSWRDERTYTPRVLYDANRFGGHGSPEQYKMWFTGRQLSSGNYAIGYAAINPVLAFSTSGSGQSGVVSTTLSQPFVVELRDSCNTPVSQVAVSFAISDTPPGATGPSLSVISGTTNSAGQISTTLRLGSLTGTYTVLAAAGGVTNLPTIFTATATMPPPPPVVWVDDDFNAGNTGGHTWGYDAFVTVQEGINAVITGGTVYVAAGIYNENPYIDKSLTLRSEAGAAATTLDGKDDAPYGVFIAANNVTLDGFTVTNPGYTYSSDASGLVIESSAGPISNIRIAHNSIHDVASLTRPSVTYGTVGINIGAVAGPVVGVEIDSNEIYNIQHSASDAWANGISIWGNDNTAQVSNVNIHNNLIYNVFSPYTGDAGISAQDFVTGVVVYRNSITGPGEFGVEVRSSSVITATENWWGNATGPTHTSNPPGAGEHVTDLVAFNPWLCQGVDTSPDIGFQPNPTLCSVASRLEFVTSPGDALVNQPLTPQPVVRAVDADGNLATTFNSAITLTIETNPASGVLSGTTTLMAAQGVVTFTGLSINKAGRGYSLSASAATLTSTTSPTFTIYAVAPLPTEKKFFLPIIFKNSH